MHEKSQFWFAFVTGQLRALPPELESENGERRQIITRPLGQISPQALLPGRF